MAAQIIISTLARTILQKLAGYGSDEAVEKVKSAWNVGTAVKKLEYTFRAICAVLADAEAKQSDRRTLRLWLSELKDLMLDIEDVVDEMEAEVLKQQLRGKFKRICHVIIFPFRLSNKIQEVQEALDNMITAAKQFALNEQPMSAQPSTRRETHSFINESKTVGREGDKAKIIEVILEASQHEHLSVLPIVGLGGIGKTILAKLVYNDAEINEKFNIKLWVSVSEVFNLKRMLEDMIQSCTGKNVTDLTLDMLQKKLRELLHKKTAIVILDDLGSDKLRGWEDFISLLSDCGSGTVLLVTIRFPVSATKIKTLDPFYVQRLSDEVCQQIFTQYAFQDEGGIDMSAELIDIVMFITKRCRGIPLAAKTLGSILSGSRSLDEWRQVSTDDLGDIKQSEDDILPTLKLSYDCLSQPLKACFASLSIFPKKQRMLRSHVIMLWMALGLLQDDSECSDPISVGAKYFHELVDRALLQDPLRCYDTSIGECGMHDLIRDLAISVSQKDHSFFRRGKMTISDRVRHIVWDHSPFTEDLLFPDEFRKASKARTFASKPKFGAMGTKYLDQLLSTFKLLRVLMLVAVEIDEVPKSIGKLKLLRFLDLRMNNGIRVLPDSLCKLVSLQNLCLSGCHLLEDLPHDVHKLVSLRCLRLQSRQKYLLRSEFHGWSLLIFLDLIDCPELVSLTENFHSLVALRELGIFNCPKLASLPCSMKDMSALEEIKISRCKVIDLMTSPTALSGLNRLRVLQLIELPKLTSFPDTILSAASSLQYLVVTHCQGLTRLPEFMVHFTFLKLALVSHCGENLDMTIQVPRDAVPAEGGPSICRTDAV